MHPSPRTLVFASLASLLSACGTLPASGDAPSPPATSAPAAVTTGPAAAAPVTAEQPISPAPVQSIDVDSTVQQLSSSGELAALAQQQQACKPTLDANTADLKALLPVIEAILKNATPANILKTLQNLDAQQLKTLFTLLSGVLKEVAGCAAAAQSQAVSLATVEVPVAHADGCIDFTVQGKQVSTCATKP